MFVLMHKLLHQSCDYILTLYTGTVRQCQITANPTGTARLSLITMSVTVYLLWWFLLLICRLVIRIHLLLFVCAIISHCDFLFCYFYRLFIIWDYLQLIVIKTEYLLSWLFVIICHDWFKTHAKRKYNEIKKIYTLSWIRNQFRILKLGSWKKIDLNWALIFKTVWKKAEWLQLIWSFK